MESRVLIPGSYDPPTKGHEHVWRTMGAMGHTVVVGIGRNAAKASALLRPETRAELARRVLATHACKSEVVLYDGLIDQTVRESRTSAVIRGLRGGEDLSTEFAMGDYLGRQGSVPVLCVLTPPEMRTFSSSFVRQLLPFEGTDVDLKRLLPDAVFRCLCGGALALRRPFHDLWKAMGASGNPDNVFEDLLLRYGANGREYHTFVHIKWVWKRIAEIRAAVSDGPAFARTDWNAILWAAIFHDAVMEGKKDDEIRSADLAAVTAGDAGMDAAFSENVHRFVLATAHEAVSDDPETQVLPDADLAILGAPETEFDAYEARVREEWNFVPDAAFREGRANILSRFLTRPIYQTAYARARWEDTARANLARSIARLRGDAPYPGAPRLPVEA